MNNKLKILIVHDNLNPGGILTINNLIFKTLQLTNKYEFYLLCGLNDGQEINKNYFKFCKKLYCYKLNNKIGYLKSILYTIRKTRQIYLNITKTQKFDYIFTNYPISALGILVSNRNYKKQVISIFHGPVNLYWELIYSNNSQKEYLWEKFKHYIAIKFLVICQKIILQKSKLIICFSKDSLYLLNKYLNIFQNIKIIRPPFLDKGNISIKSSYGKLKIKQSLGISPIKRLITFYSTRIDPNKGVLLFLDAIRLMNNNLKKKSIFLIIGNIDKNFLEYFIKIFNNSSESNENFMNIIFKPTITDQRILYKYIAVSDAIVVPSAITETYSMSILEALSARVPVLGTPVGAIPEILKKISTNLIAEDNTPESFSKTLSWFITLSESEIDKLQNRIIMYTENKLDNINFIQSLENCFT